MKTNIEEYLKKNRSSMDVEDPDDDFIWSGIQSELNTKPSIRLFSWKAAAIILLALVTGFVLNSVLNPKPKVVSLMLAEISPEYAEREKFYQASIQQKWDQINSRPYQKTDYADIFREMDQLEKLKAESLDDMIELGSNPRLVKTLFEYYKIKNRLLEIMLAEMDKKRKNELKPQSDEKYF